MASMIFNRFWADLVNNAINPTSDTIKVMLVNGYAPDKDTHTRRSDVTGEVTGAGYVAGGKTVAVTVSQDNDTDHIDLALGIVSWANATIDATGAVFYKARGGAANADELVAFVDFGGHVISTNNTWEFTSATVIRLAN